MRIYFFYILQRPGYYLGSPVYTRQLCVTCNDIIHVLCIIEITGALFGTTINKSKTQTPACCGKSGLIITWGPSPSSGTTFFDSPPRDSDPSSLLFDAGFVEERLENLLLTISIPFANFSPFLRCRFANNFTNVTDTNIANAALLPIITTDIPLHIHS